MGQADAAFGFERRRWYKPREQTGVAQVKRVNLLEYFDLAEALAAAKRATAPQTSKGGDIYFATYSLPVKLKAFVADDNGFSTCKHVARSLAEVVEDWWAKNLYREDGGGFDTQKLDVELHSYMYRHIGQKVDTFRSVFEAECRDVDVYSVGQIAIYKTSALVSDGAAVLPVEVRRRLNPEVLSEFNNAGRCLAFGLPTACGFHALRGLELVMDTYLQSFGVKTASFKSWMDYILAAQKLTAAEEKPFKGKALVAPIRKPSAKVATMLDRMRELDRNPLMHPRNVLDDVAAHMLFELSAITIVEMVKDMKEPDDGLEEQFIGGLIEALPDVEPEDA